MPVKNEAFKQIERVRSYKAMIRDPHGKDANTCRRDQGNKVGNYQGGRQHSEVNQKEFNDLEHQRNDEDFETRKHWFRFWGIVDMNVQLAV